MLLLKFKFISFRFVKIKCFGMLDDIRGVWGFKELGFNRFSEVVIGLFI